MIRCILCESLIPSYYDKCPVCAANLDRTRVLRFRISKHDVKSDSQDIGSFVERSELSLGEARDVSNQEELE